MNATTRFVNWSWSVLVIVLLLLGTISWMSLRQKFTEDLVLARQATEQQLQLIASILSSELAVGRYQDIERLFDKWTKASANVAQLQLIAANGFVLATYQRPGNSEHILVIESPISYSYQGEARVRIRVDLADVYQRQQQLVTQIAAIFAVFSALLFLFLHFAIQRQREALRRRENEQRLQAIIETEPECVKLLGRDGEIIEMNSAGLAMLEADSLVAAQRKTLVNFVNPEYRAAFVALYRRVMRGETGLLEFEVTGLKGGRKWLETHAAPLRDVTGKVEMLLGITRDITERKQAEEKIRRLSRVYAVLSGIDAAIVRITDRVQLFQEACRIAVEIGRFRMAWLGVLDREAMVVKPIASAGDVRDFLDVAPLGVIETEPGGNGRAGRAIREKRPIVSNDVKTDPLALMRNQLDERGINSLAVIPLIIGDEAVGVFAFYAAEVGVFNEDEMRLLLELAGDVSFALDHIDKAEKVHYLAYYDSVTGLANRTLFHERLEQGLTAAVREGRKLALVILDIERFKTINDTLGRQAGDTLLKQIADRMAGHAPDIAWLARIGADHFAIMAPDIQNVDDLARLTEQRLEKFFGPPFRIGETELRIAAKLGIAMFPGDGSDAETLFRNAEAALKKAKESGDRYLFYTQAMNERVAEKMALENKLRQALEKEEFVLHYQPKVDLETRSIVGVEALIRWQSPELGLVPPMKFISLLEETGLILPVGTWALKRASLDHKGWVNQGLKAPRVAVNVSPIQLRQRDFVASVEQAIIEGVAPTGIDLEITESLIMEDIQGNIEKLKAVRGLGVTIAIDDFGTGYSSLGYLAKLPVQTLKIDRSFIITMLKDPGAMTLVQTMISLAHSLNLKVVAEGVDAEEQAKSLRLLHCDEMQGYLFSRPVPFDQLTALLTEKARG